MVADLLLILGLGVHDDLGKHLGKDVFEEFGSEDHLGPVVARLEDVKDVAWWRGTGMTGE